MLLQNILWTVSLTIKQTFELLLYGRLLENNVTATLFSNQKFIHLRVYARIYLKLFYD